MLFRSRTDYRVTVLDERLAVRAEGRKSASGLIREVGLDVVDCPELTWSWRVDKMQPAADIRAKTKEDVAAISKAKRVEARHLGAVKSKVKIQSRGFPKKEKKEKISLPPRRSMFEDS